MNAKDFKPGAKGFIFISNSDVSPSNVHIVGVVIEGTIGDLIAYDPIDEHFYSVEPKDVFYTWADARKKALRFLSKTFKKLSNETGDYMTTHCIACISETCEKCAYAPKRAEAAK